MEPLKFVLIFIFLLGTSVAAFLYSRIQRTKRLKTKFGTEYERLVIDGVNPRKAEAELADRERQAEKLFIQDLTTGEVERFSRLWREVQARFVDRPKRAVVEADGLIRDVMTARGYPVTDFERRVAYISVEYPHLVESYRSAHAVAGVALAGHGTSEDLFVAMMHYRRLFEDLFRMDSVLEMEEAGTREPAIAPVSV